MDIRGKKLVVIGGAGLIGSHTVDFLIREDVGGIVVYDNFVRGTHENLAGALRDPRVKIFEAGGDIYANRHSARGDRRRRRRVSFRSLVAVAMPRISACRVRRKHPWHLQCDGGLCRREGEASRLFVVGVGLWRRRRRADDRGSSVQQQELLRRDEDLPGRRCCGRSTTATGSITSGLRYMNVYGPRQDYHGAYIAVIMKMLDAIDQGRGADHPRRRFRSVRFRRGRGLRRGEYLRHERRSAVDRFYNVGTGKRTSLKEVAEKLLALTGQQSADEIRAAQPGDAGPQPYRLAKARQGGDRICGWHCARRRPATADRLAQAHISRKSRRRRAAGRFVECVTAIDGYRSKRRHSDRPAEPSARRNGRRCARR